MWSKQFSDGNVRNLVNQPYLYCPVFVIWQDVSSRNTRTKKKIIQKLEQFKYKKIKYGMSQMVNDSRNLVICLHLCNTVDLR